MYVIYIWVCILIIIMFIIIYYILMLPLFREQNRLSMKSGFWNLIYYIDGARKRGKIYRKWSLSIHTSKLQTPFDLLCPSAVLYMALQVLCVYILYCHCSTDAFTSLTGIQEKVQVLPKVFLQAEDAHNVQRPKHSSHTLFVYKL